MFIKVAERKQDVILLFAALLVSNLSPAEAQDRLRIQRPNRTVSASPEVSSSKSQPNAGFIAQSETATLSSSLPASGLFAHWRTQFSNPTVCPIRLCHGSCAKTDMSCKSTAPMLQILLDAFLPDDDIEQVPILNFRCCAGFTEDE